MKLADIMFSRNWIDFMQTVDARVDLFLEEKQDLFHMKIG